MDHDDSLLGVIRGEISTFVQAYPDTHLAAKQNMQQLLVGETKTFLRAAVDVLASTTPTEGSRYLLSLLAKERTMADTLVTPGLCPLGQAIAVARLLGAALEQDLDAALSALMRGNVTEGERLLRVLEIMEAAGVERRCLPYQVDLLATKDPSLRAKVAKLITRSSRKASVAARFLLDPDPRVQASAVEGLWSLDAAEASPLLIAATRSRNFRVVANAAIGLHRFHDPVSIRLIWGLANNPDVQTRTAGVWVMGESSDPRFFAYLEQLSTDGKGVPRQVILRALSRIKARQAEAMERGSVQIRVQSAVSAPSGDRKIELSLGPALTDFSRVHALEFSITEGSATVDRYELTSKPTPPVWISDFVLPRLISLVDPFRVAIDSGIRRCIPLRRPDDQWRFDRYCTESRPPRNWSDKTPSPYDDYIPLHKLYRGFSADPALLDRVLETPPQKERCAFDLGDALDRGTEAITGVPGAHNAFVFLAANALERTPPARWAKHLEDIFSSGRIAVHVFAPSDVDAYEICEAFRDVPDCMVETCTLDDMPARVEYAYARLLNNFEIQYALTTPPADGTISICGTAGQGSAPFSFR